ncbi:MAG: FAD-dependent oxidoreductase [Gammaproteobacteria bacterium]|jgi:glycerol-3-phosphate dehydrogenase
MSVASYDVVVVGGGINGVGVAQAAAAAGYSVMLLEKQAVAAGTSSKSSKLIHGGLRYLESYEFGLVRESLRERALLLKLAPDLVQKQTFILPVYKDMRRSPWLLRTGLSLYYLLSGLDADARFSKVPRAAWGSLEGLRTDGLEAVFRYMDARTDDALLTEAVMRSAQSLGAQLSCPGHFSGAEIHNAGCRVHYRVGQAERECDAQVIVNAAGPWVNAVVDGIKPSPPRMAIELVQGAHIVLPVAGSEFEGQNFYYVESPRDGRAVFVMPRGPQLLIGTTETRGRKDPEQVAPLPAEETYLLGILHHYFPALRHLGRNDLLGSWAGLRVLPGGEGHAFHRSRETVLHCDRKRGPRVLTIYGGKLTSYRVTAGKVMDKIRGSLPNREAVADTRELTLSLD